MQDAKIIILVGMPGAGKSTCVDYLASKNVPSVYFGGVIVDETKRRNGGQTSEALERVVREELRAAEGMGAVATRMIPKIEALIEEGNAMIVADGLYSWTEYKIFKEHWGDRAVVIAIAAPRRMRHERLANRPIRPLTEDEVTAREYAEIENIEKGGPIANADYTITNAGATDRLLEQLNAILQDIA